MKFLDHSIELRNFTSPKVSNTVLVSKINSLRVNTVIKYHLDGLYEDWVLVSKINSLRVNTVIIYHLETC